MNPFAEVRKEFARELASRINTDAEKIEKRIETPPSEDLGDVAVPLREIAPRDRYNELKFEGKLIRSTQVVGIYLNAFVNEKELFKLTFSFLGPNYGLEKTDSPKRVVVEHTSANPVHPLHIGHLRNAVLGDTIANLLKLRGHAVNVRFYVNDAGRQSATLAYGMAKLGWPSPPSNAKKDVWLGLVYACTNVIIEVNKLKRQLETLKDKPEEYSAKVRELDDLVSVAEGLRERDSSLFDRLAEEIGKDPEPDRSVQELMLSYEWGKEPTKELVRRVANAALEGISQTLSSLDIHFDSFDYESDLIWDGSVSKIIQMAREKKVVTVHKGATAITFDLLTEDERKFLRIPKGLNVPPLILVRADGTTLYPTRDLAYTLLKYRDFNAHTVINVIAEEQTTPQIQLRAALYLMGFKSEAVNLLHFSYSMVNVEGMKMSGRRGRYFSVDEVIEQVRAAVSNRVKERGGGEGVEDLVRGAVRFAIIAVAPNKPISFSVQRAIDFNQNSGPYLQYTYARASSVLSKVESFPSLEEVDFSDLKNDKRRLLILISKFPDIFISTADDMRPEVMTTYLNKLADVFNRLYDTERILQDPIPGKRALKLWLVRGVETVLRNGLSALRIKPLSKV